MCQGTELIRLNDGKRRVLSTKYSLVAILLRLTVVDQVREGLRERLEIHQKLLIVLQNMEILLRAHHLVQK